MFEIAAMMNTCKAALPIGILILFFVGCKPEPPAINHYSDPSILRIAQLQDQRNAMGLLPYMKAKKPIHRVAAMRALGSVQDTGMVSYLTIAMMSDQEAEVRKLAAYAIGQLRDSNNSIALMKGLNRELDADAQAEMMIALGKGVNSEGLNFLAKLDKEDNTIRNARIAALFHARRHAQFAATCQQQMLLATFDSKLSMRSRMMAGYALASTNYEPIPASMQEAQKLLDSCSNRDLKVAVRRAFGIAKTGLDNTVQQLDTANNPYDLATFITQKSGSAVSASMLEHYLRTHRFQIVRTTSAEYYFKHCLGEIDIDQITQVVQYCLKSRDMGLISHAANFISANLDTLPVDSLKPLIDRALERMAFPRQLETIYDLQRLKAKINGEDFKPEDVAYNHPIDWNMVKQIPRNQRVKIETTKGEMIIELHVERAPGSVWNFLTVVRSGDYNGRYFHRVVPNFVIQGGCPRGDGWGAPDWTQRSEFSNDLRYQRGSVGLASVGNDTEGIQFFVTHCSTPHLDGRYTIFATVVEGLDVIDKVRVGDRILKVIEL